MIDSKEILPPHEFLYQNASKRCPSLNHFPCSAVIPSLPLTIKWLRDCVKEHPSTRLQVIVTWMFLDSYVAMGGCFLLGLFSLTGDIQVNSFKQITTNFAFHFSFFPFAMVCLQYLVISTSSLHLPPYKVSLVFIGWSSLFVACPCLLHFVINCMCVLHMSLSIYCETKKEGGGVSWWSIGVLVEPEV